MQYKILADENIPFVRELFEPFGEIVLKAGRDIDGQDLVDTDFLLVRSVTPVNESLLGQSTVKFVGTCTIGVDHLDLNYLNAKQISYASAPGCNAGAVTQYVIAALNHFDLLESRSAKVLVVGAGNVGSKVVKALGQLGFDVSVCDPLIAESSGLSHVDLSYVSEADIVCLHAPLTFGGSHPTYHMFNREVLSQLKENALLISAGRGAVIDNSALSTLLSERDDIRCVLDVWENEPNIDKQLLELVDIASPHIAGYSFEGRVTGSLMIFDALCQHLGVPGDWARIFREQVTNKVYACPQSFKYASLKDSVRLAYDISNDHKNLLSEKGNLPKSFDLLRKHYPRRREFSHFLARAIDEKHRATMSAIGFLSE